jgi:hypothetical protein
MKTFYILIFIFINVQLSFGQVRISQLPVRPFEQIKYNGVSPKWHYTFFLQNHVTDTTDGYGTPYFADQITDFEKDDNTIVTTDAVYQAYNYTPFRTGTMVGSYVEKLDIRTGALLWRVYYGPPLGRAEFVRHMIINQSNKLVLINQQSINPNQNYLNSQELILSIRVLDLNSGQELSYKKADDSLGLRIPFSSFSSVSELFCEDDGNKIRYTKQYFPPNNIYARTYVSKSIDTNTAQNDTAFDTLYSANDYIPFEIKQLEDQSLFVSILDTAHRKFDFKIMKPDFSLISQYSSEVLPKWMFRVTLQGFDVKTRSLLFAHQVGPNPPFQFFPAYEFYKIDGNGSVTDMYFMPEKYELGYYSPLQWKLSDTIYMINSTYNYTSNSRLYNTLDILQCLPSDTCKVVKSYLSLDSLRTIGAFSIHEINDDEVYLRFYEGSAYEDKATGSYLIDRYARAMSGMRISKRELISGISSVADLLLIEDVLSYPNPSSDHVFIKMPVSNSGNYTVYNLEGKIVTTNGFINQEEIELNISHLPQGRYEVSSELNIINGIGADLLNYSALI